MTSLGAAVGEYLAMRRSLGFKLDRTEKLLAQFIRHLEAVAVNHITTDVAVAWATSPVGTRRIWWARRLTVVRGFARYLQAFDPTTEVPPTGLFPGQRRLTVPYLYSDEDIEALVAAAGDLARPLRVLTYRTLIRLLAVTGMRIGEAIRLDRKDLDFEEGVLTVWFGKFGKSRELPLHDSTCDALRAYLQQRDRLYPRPPSPSLLISTAGTRLRYPDVQSTFARLVRQAGLEPRSAHCRPRLHDLRHTFAVRTLIDAYRADVNVGAHLPLLSTYLGHIDPRNTYWYLSAAPELLGLASQRLERHLEGVS